MTPQALPVIESQGITKSYRLGALTYPVLHSIDLCILRGEFVALTGASGSGKSTLMNILGCLDVSDSGSYRLGGHDVAGLGQAELAQVRNRRLGFVFQNFYLLPRSPAWANVAQPLVYRGVAPAQRHEAACDALRRVGLADRLNHKPSELSGGQRQRVAIARALISKPQILLADEPTGNLDSTTSAGIMDLFADLNAAGMTLVVVTHEPGIAARCKRVVHLRDGRIVSDVSQSSRSAVSSAA